MSQTSDDTVDANTGDTPITTNRRMLVLRALRIGGLIAFLAVSLLACLWWDGFPVPQNHANQFLLSGAPLPLLWLLGFWKWASKVWFACLALINAVPLAALQVYRWWLFHSQSFVSVSLFLALALLVLGLGVFIIADLLLRVLRDQLDISRRDPTNPARSRPLRDTNATSRWHGCLLRLALVAGAVVVPVAPVLLTSALTGPVSTAVTAPEGDLPTLPTTIGSEVTWRQDVRGLIEVRVGAAGPILLTKDDVTALRPGNETALWSYRRHGARYLRIPDNANKVHGLNRDKYNDRVTPHMVTSPTGHHVTLRIVGPEGLREKYPTTHAGHDSSVNAMTIVIDTLTGQATGEHPSNEVQRLQLSDSAILDGRIAYSLEDGEKLWPFAEKKYEYRGYSGPAGHRYFIATNHKQTNSPHVSIRITLTPDSAIRTDSKRVGITLDTDAEGFPVLVNGWAIQPKNPDDVLCTDTDWEAQAVSLDSLIGFGDEEPVDLSRITGVHHDISHRSGVLRTSESVFDPTTRTVTPVSQYPGLAGARTGIDTTIRGGRQPRELVIRPGDGSAEFTIPAKPDSVSLLVEEKEPVPSEPEKKTIFLSAPGVTLVALDPENGIEHHSSKDGDYIHTRTHRLYGVTGGSARAQIDD